MFFFFILSIHVSRTKSPSKTLKAHKCLLAPKFSTQSLEPTSPARAARSQTNPQDIQGHNPVARRSRKPPSQSSRGFFHHLKIAPGCCLPKSFPQENAASQSQRSRLRLQERKSAVERIQKRPFIARPHGRAVRIAK